MSMPAPQRPMPRGDFHNVLSADARGSVLKVWRHLAMGSPSAAALHIGNPWAPDLPFMMKLGRQIGVPHFQVLHDLGLQPVTAARARS